MRYRSSAARKDGAEGNRAIQNGGPAVPTYFTTFRRPPGYSERLPPNSPRKVRRFCVAAERPPLRFHVRSQPLALALQILDLGLEVRDFLLRRCKSFFQQWCFKVFRGVY